MISTNNERRWYVRQLLIAVNLLILGIAFYADATGIPLDSFKNAMAGFEVFTGLAFMADYATKSDK